MGKNENLSKKFNHFRKGIIGDWRNHFDIYDHKKFIDNFYNKMKGLDITYYLGENEYLTCDINNKSNLNTNE